MMENALLSFIWPSMLTLLLLLPVLVMLYLGYQQRRQRQAEALGSLGLLQDPAGRAPGRSRHVPPLLFLAGLSLLILALARPETTLHLPRVEGTVMLVFDVSGSMAAEDVQPNRMEVAKETARQFVQQQPLSVQVGVVSFSDSGFALQMPTNDQDAILAAINRLEPQRGTSLGQGILASLKTIAVNAGWEPANADPQQPAGSGSGAPPDLDQVLMEDLPQGKYPSAIIVLLSDGENHESPDPLAAAQAAREREVRIYTLGVGTPAGADLQLDGFTVHTQLDETALQQVAQLAGGAYYKPETETDLQAVYQNVRPQLVVKPEKFEVTSVLTGLSLLALLAGGAFSLRWFGRMP